MTIAGGHGVMGVGTVRPHHDGCATVCVVEAGWHYTGAPSQCAPGVVSVVQGRLNHTCALRANGSVKCWGRNYYGELGLGDTNGRGDLSAEIRDNLLQTVARERLEPFLAAARFQPRPNAACRPTVEPDLRAWLNIAAACICRGPACVRHGPGVRRQLGQCHGAPEVMLDERLALTAAEGRSMGSRMAHLRTSWVIATPHDSPARAHGAHNPWATVSSKLVRSGLPGERERDSMLRRAAA